MEEDIKIPFLGDNDVSNDTTNVASWVASEDRVPLLLALSTYGTPRQSLDGYTLVLDRPRADSWVNFETNTIIIGLKGTSEGTLLNDLGDDIIIMSNPSYCELTLVKEGEQLVADTLIKMKQRSEDLVTGRLEVSNTDPQVIFVGHSLGGTAAMCLTLKFPDSRGISFNGGAAPTNPILAGPGPQRFTHYHIVGDLISTHMDERAARVVRIKIPGVEFGSQTPHNTGNILKEGSLFDATSEDMLYVKWGTKPSFIYSIVSKLIFIPGRFLTKLRVENVVAKSPIPNSNRFFTK